MNVQNGQPTFTCRNCGMTVTSHCIIQLKDGVVMAFYCKCSTTHLVGQAQAINAYASQDSAGNPNGIVIELSSETPKILTPIARLPKNLKGQ